MTFDESITRHQDPLWQLVAGFPRVNSGQAVRPAFPACENYLLPVAGPPDIRRSIEFADCRWAREIGLPAADDEAIIRRIDCRLLRLAPRPEELLVGQACVSTCTSGWSPYR